MGSHRLLTLALSLAVATPSITEGRFISLTAITPSEARGSGALMQRLKR